MLSHFALSPIGSPVMQVGADGTFVGGDLELSKGDEDEFEAEITGAKPGIWLMSVEAVEAEDGGEDDLMGATPKIVRFVWKSDGTVNYASLPRASVFQWTAAADPDDDAEWEVVGTFSVDSGTVCLFSKHALDELLSTGEDRQAMLESLVDMDEGDKVFVPAGIVGKHSHELVGCSYLTVSSRRERWRIRDRRDPGRGGEDHCVEVASVESLDIISARSQLLGHFSLLRKYDLFGISRVHR